jgi:hypothetical protein
MIAPWHQQVTRRNRKPTRRKSDQGEHHMKYVKMLALAAVATMALMAVAGAGMASATVLCKEKPNASNVCPAGKLYPSGTVLQATSTSAFLDTNFVDVTCHSAVSAKTTSAGGAAATVLGTIESLTFTGCKTVGNRDCEVEVENLPYKAEVHNTATVGNGLLTVTGHSGEPSAQVVCRGFLDCTFGNTKFELPIDGGNPAKVTANTVNLGIKEGFFCPIEAKWTATYTTTSPTAVWVGKE